MSLTIFVVTCIILVVVQLVISVILFIALANARSEYRKISQHASALESNMNALAFGAGRHNVATQEIMLNLRAYMMLNGQRWITTNDEEGKIVANMISVETGHRGSS